MNRMKVILLIMTIFLGQYVAAQNSNKNAKEAEIKIKTSAQCEMCKETIEKALVYEKGVINADLNVETKYVTVKYKTSKTNTDKIRLAINNAGYDADDKPANEKAYAKLSPCCKKPGDPSRTEHK